MMESAKKSLLLLIAVCLMYLDASAFSIGSLLSRGSASSLQTPGVLSSLCSCLPESVCQGRAEEKRKYERLMKLIFSLRELAQRGLYPSNCQEIQEGWQLPSHVLANGSTECIDLWLKAINPFAVLSKPASEFSTQGGSSFSACNEFQNVMGNLLSLRLSEGYSAIEEYLNGQVIRNMAQHSGRDQQSSMGRFGSSLPEGVCLNSSNFPQYQDPRNNCGGAGGSDVPETPFDPFFVGQDSGSRGECGNSGSGMNVLGPQPGGQSMDPASLATLFSACSPCASSSSRGSSDDISTGELLSKIVQTCGQCKNSTGIGSLLLKGAASQCSCEEEGTDSVVNILNGLLSHIGQRNFCVQKCGGRGGSSFNSGIWNTNLGIPKGLDFNMFQKGRGGQSKSPCMFDDLMKHSGFGFACSVRPGGMGSILGNACSSLGSGTGSDTLSALRELTLKHLTC